MKSCKKCQSSFEVTDADRGFYQKMNVPEPTLCQDCRNQNRIAFRNEEKFYKRECDLCQKSMISLYSKDKPFKVYCSKCWWSDQFDPLEYGCDYNPNRSFFDQIHDLANQVPKPAIMNMNSENCDYTNYSAENRNCYISIGTLGSENCYYGYRIFYSKDIVDCYDLIKCELCYECTQSRNLYNSSFCNSCEDSSDLILCNDCYGCKNCFGCVNLRKKEYCIYNKTYTEDEYKAQIIQLKKQWKKSVLEYEKLKLNLPCRAKHMLNTENCSGDQISNSKNCHYCFSVHHSEECQYVYGCENGKYYCDVNFGDNCELAYNSSNLEKNYNIIGANLVWYTKDSCYVTNCFNSNNLFGCVGMKKNSYCILNKQYTKENYEKLRLEIIEKMKADGEWGEYYPIEHSPFAYNETLAEEYYPLTREIAQKKGWKWKNDIDMPIEVEKIIPGKQLPDDIKNIPDDVLNWAIECETTNRPFKITAQELDFYRKQNIPLPHFHPNERRRKRMEKMNHFHLFHRTCANCAADIQTTYSPKRPEKVYCEQCYLKEVY